MKSRIIQNQQLMSILLFQVGVSIPLIVLQRFCSKSLSMCKIISSREVIDVAMAKGIIKDLILIHGHTHVHMHVYTCSLCFIHTHPLIHTSTHIFIYLHTYTPSHTYIFTYKLHSYMHISDRFVIKMNDIAPSLQSSKQLLKSCYPQTLQCAQCLM